MFRHTISVEFQHCDPARIVFYPRYFEMISSTVERFFTDALGHGFAGQLDGGTGIPMARIEVDFHAPSRLGERLNLDLTVLRVGTTSAAFRIQCSGPDARFTAKGTLVHFDFHAGRPAPWPDALRAGLSKHLSTEPA